MDWLAPIARIGTERRERLCSQPVRFSRLLSPSLSHLPLQRPNGDHGAANQNRRCAFSSSLQTCAHNSSVQPLGPSQAEILLRVTSGIAAELINAYDEGKSASLNEIRNKVSKKHSFMGVPRLVDIISAIPDEYKKALLPKLRARPIRTASGVSRVNLLLVI